MTINPKARFERKENAIDVQPFRVVALETINEIQWQRFSQNLLDDYHFIAGHAKDLHVGSDGVTNALLVLNEETGEGILVNSEGFSCARYSAYLPFAKLYLDSEIARVADDCVTKGLENASDGMRVLDFGEIRERFGIDVSNDEHLKKYFPLNTDFFGRPTNLTVSGQLNGETFAMAFRNIYTFGPTFRAENSNTTRHAAEFWMIEPEIAFADLKDDMMLAESMLKYIINYVLENAPEEMNFFNSFVDKGLIERLKHVAESEFAHVTYTEAVELLMKNNDSFDYKVSWGCDLQTEHERYLTEEIFKRPVFVTDYPKEIKAFYMKLNEDNKTVAAMDLLVPGIGEIIGGSQREDNYEKLAKRMTELGLKEEDYDFYLDLRKYGSARHAGFGLGFERCIMYLTGMSNIRDVIPFPRTVNNCAL